MSDGIDVARGNRQSKFGIPAVTLRAPRAARTAVPAPTCTRMQVQDNPGALAKVARGLGDWGIPIDRMRPHGHQDTIAPVLIVTPKTTRAALDEALSGFEATGVVEGTPVVIRV